MPSRCRANRKRDCARKRFLFGSSGVPSRVLCLHSTSPSPLPPSNEFNRPCASFSSSRSSSLCPNDFSKARDSPTIFIVLYRRWKTRAITGTMTPDASSCPLSRRFSGPECPASFVGRLCSFSTGIHWWTALSSYHRDSTRPPVQR